MSEQQQPSGQEPSKTSASTATTARKLVFDDPLGSPSRDDSDLGWGGEEPSGTRDEAWYRRETPPHHGG